jgi:hypothetical protein
MASSLPENKAVTSPLRVSSSQSVALLVWALHRTVADVTSSLTVQEGLYRAYTRDFLCLADFDGIPDDLREAVDAIVRTLGEAFGFDSATGQKKRPSTLGEQDAAVLLARLRAITAAAEKVAARL